MKLIRNHILKCTECTTNNLILAPPKAFIYLDKNVFIQNKDEIPVFYHLYRTVTKKSFNTNLINSNELRYDISTAILDGKRKDIYKYWWILI